MTHHLRRLGVETGRGYAGRRVVCELLGRAGLRVGQILAEAAQLASERLAAKGMAPLPHTTPHTLRRTYISIALLANQFDLKFVMAQIGHADSSMTMDVYAQLEQRAKRSHDESFDRLLAEARERVAALPLHSASTSSAEPI